jgi:hypothetical protein
MESERVKSIEVGRDVAVRGRGVGEVLSSDNDSRPMSILWPRSCRPWLGGGVLAGVYWEGGLEFGPGAWGKGRKDCLTELYISLAFDLDSS